MEEELELLIRSLKQEQDIFKKSKIIDQLTQIKGLRVKEISRLSGLNQAYICHLKRLKKLPELIIDGYYSGLVKPTHLYIISRAPSLELMINLYEMILAKDLSVSETEEALRELAKKVSGGGAYVSKEFVRKWAKVFEEKYPGSNLTLTQTRTRARIILEVKGSLDFTSRMIKKFFESLS